MAEYYRKKPIVVEAQQWRGDNAAEMQSWMRFDCFTELGGSMRTEGGTAQIWVEANKEWLRIETGEWVIKDARGFYPCKSDMFEATYERDHSGTFGKEA